MRIAQELKGVFAMKTLKTILIISGVVVFLSVSGFLFANNPDIYYNDRNSLILNPAYKIKRLSTGTVIAYSNKENGELISHEFENIYAEVLLGAKRKQSVDQLIYLVSKKYYYAEDESRREIKHAVNVLQEWDILISNRTILL